RAASEQECALKRVDRAPDRLSRGKGAEIVALTRARPAVLVYARGRVVACDEDVGKGLVVTQQNVKPRAQPLDKISLKQKRLYLRPGNDELHGRRLAHHAADAVGVKSALRVLPYPLLHLARLAHLKHNYFRIYHAF